MLTVCRIESWLWSYHLGIRVTAIESYRGSQLASLSGVDANDRTIIVTSETSARRKRMKHRHHRNSLNQTLQKKKQANYVYLGRNAQKNNETIYLPHPFVFSSLNSLLSRVQYAFSEPFGRTRRTSEPARQKQSMSETDSSIDSDSTFGRPLARDCFVLSLSLQIDEWSDYAADTEDLVRKYVQDGCGTLRPA